MANEHIDQNGFRPVGSYQNTGTTIVTISGGTEVPSPTTESPFESIQSRKAALFSRLSSCPSFNQESYTTMSSAAPMNITNETSRMAKRSQLVTSHSVSSEVKSSSTANEIKSLTNSNQSDRNLNCLSRAQSDLKNFSHSALSQTSENRNYARNMSVSSTSQNSNSRNFTRMRPGLKFDQLENAEFPEQDSVVIKSTLSSPSIVSCNSKELKFEQQSRSSSSKTKISSNNFISEEQTAHNSETKRVQSDDLTYEESSVAAASKSKLEMDGLSEERCSAARHDHKTKLSGNILQEESKKAAASKVKINAPGFSSENVTLAAQQEKKTVVNSQVLDHEKQSAAASQSHLTLTTKGISTKTSKTIAQAEVMKNGQVSSAAFTSSSCSSGDFAHLNKDSSDIEVEKVALKYSEELSSSLDRLKSENRLSDQTEWQSINNIISNAFAVPIFGNDLGTQLCNVLKNHGGLDLLLENCPENDSDGSELQMSCAKLMEKCLTTENRSYVVDKGLGKVVNMAKKCTSSIMSDVEYARVGTGILESLFKDSESTCSDVIKLGGLDTVLAECRKNDVETLRHCACALANLSLYGGSENQQLMIKYQVPMWLFPLAFHNDDCVKYYACLAIAALVANKEIEAAVLKSGTLDLVEPFLLSHSPSEFAKNAVSYVHGQNKSWLQRLVPILSSKREEACNLATFQFAMEANISKDGLSKVLHEIGAVGPLKQVASSPNAVASRYAAEALSCIGEVVPHKLSQQVPLWSTDDVAEWVSQIGFPHLTSVVHKSRVDGDLLLQLTEGMLKDDLEITNGILRKRFIRELNNLKKMCDYSSCDPTDLNGYLNSIDPDFTIYTYNMLIWRIDKDIIRALSDEQLLKEVGITNSIHRSRILEMVKKDNSPNTSENLDVFISYRRSNGSQLASLLKVHLQLRGFSVFIDVERLEAGKFDNNLLNSIKQAKHFLLVLTPNSLDRCIGDADCKDWIHRETVAALENKCNIIPIIDNFMWPQVEELPDDMRSIASFNGVRWIHDYQDACVDKLERFMKGEINFE